jgi:hypothetical protein
MSGALEKSLAILEYLADYPDGAGLAQISTELAGPSARLTLERMQQLGPALVLSAGELSMSADASPLLKSANVGTSGNVAEKRVRNVR